MPAVTTWTVKHYNLAGNLVAELDEIADRQMTLAMNGLDSFSGTLYLDDPDAAAIQRLHSIIKVWRNVSDPANGKSYTAPADRPDFAGVVTYSNKDGISNQMQFKAFSPFWRLQCRFHLLNHYLVNNPSTGLPWKQSALMWKLIDLINNAFGVTSKTGIVQGTLSSATDVAVSPYFVMKGSNTWQHVFETIMDRASSPDIVPVYLHTDGSPDLVQFGTSLKRGSDVSASTLFQYSTGLDNCLNMSEEEQIIPDTFANYLWLVGQGGPNKYPALSTPPRQEDPAATGDGYGNIGIYMGRRDYENTKDIGLLNNMATHEFNRAKKAQRIYTVQLAPLWPPYYKTDFVLGDVVRLDADKGALVLSNVKQRIYEIALQMSMNNVETAQVALASDFDGKVAVTA